MDVDELCYAVGFLFCESSWLSSFSRRVTSTGLVYFSVMANGSFLFFSFLFSVLESCLFNA